MQQSDIMSEFSPTGVRMSSISSAESGKTAQPRPTYKKAGNRTAIKNTEGRKKGGRKGCNPICHCYRLRLLKNGARGRPCDLFSGCPLVFFARSWETTFSTNTAYLQCYRRPPRDAWPLAIAKNSRAISGRRRLWYCKRVSHCEISCCDGWRLVTSWNMRRTYCVSSAFDW